MFIRNLIFGRWNKGEKVKQRAHEYGGRCARGSLPVGRAGGSLRQALAAIAPLAPPPRLQHCNTHSPERPTPTCPYDTVRHAAPQSSCERQWYRIPASIVLLLLLLSIATDSFEGDTQPVILALLRFERTRVV